MWPRAELDKTIDLLAGASERVAAGTMPAAKRNELQMMVGLNYNPTGMLADPRLRSHCSMLEVATYDWVHTMLSDGVLSVETQVLLKACEPLGIRRTHLHDFLKDDRWCFPKHGKTKAKQLYRVFDSHRASASEPEKVKCSCAELLGLYGLLRHFVEVEVGRPDEIRAELASFHAACRVVDCMLLAKRRLIDPAAAARQLDDAVQSHLALHVAAYGTGELKPKHHWLLDIPSQVLRDGCVLDAFVIERQHLLVKSVAEHIDNTKAFESSVLSSLCTVLLNSDSVANGLKGKAAPLPGHPGVLVADGMHAFNFSVAVDDVVARGRAAGLVRACATEQGDLFAVVEVLVHLRAIAGHAHAYRPSGGHEVWPMRELEQVLAWYADDGDSLVVLHC